MALETLRNLFNKFKGESEAREYTPNIDREYSSYFKDEDCPYAITPKMAEEIAKNRTYSLRKYVLYDNVINELDKLKEKYRLILLTDNWPSITDYLNEYKISDYFEKVYISSIYGCVKRNRVFFDYPINDFNIKEGEALFIDDAEKNLEAAKEKGLDVLLMDRKKLVKDSKYKVINDLKDV